MLALQGITAPSYQQVKDLAERLACSGFSPMLIALEADMAKALGHALSLLLPKGAPILYIDRVQLAEDSYLDVGSPVGPCLPVVIKTLALANHENWNGGNYEA